MRISACLIVKDEADRVAAALAAVSFLDEVLVLDSGSTDGTQEICRRAGARVLDTDWPGYAAQRNRASAEAANDWVLHVDADEVVDADLRAALTAWRDAHAAREPAEAARPVRRKVFAYGRWIRHGGWYPEHRLRLYDRRRARWAGTIHEWLEVDGPEGPALAGHLEHRPWRSPAEHRERLGRYADLAAHAMFAEGRRAGVVARYLRPAFRFVRMYVLKAGFLDGAAGFRVAALESGYVFRKYARLAELRRVAAAGRSA